MIEIGAGGGSVAGADALGVLRVGPQSAGADPGPACYGRHGTRPTLTDANLVLGLHDPERFLGGTMRLDAEAARSAIAAGVATPLGINVERAASGIHEIINEDVARAFRIHASERGIDYRNCTMIAFGGSGPAHAIRIARKLRIRCVVIPRGAGVFSALGLLVSPLAFEVVRSRPLPLADIRDGWWQTHIAALLAEATAPLRKASVAADAMRLRCRLDMRYIGQGHEVEVALPERAAHLDAADLAALFEERYSALYAHTVPATPVQIMTWKVEAVGPDPLAGQAVRIEGTAMPRLARRARRTAHVEEAGRIDCPVYDRSFLAPRRSDRGSGADRGTGFDLHDRARRRGAYRRRGNLVVDLALQGSDGDAVAAEGRRYEQFGPFDAISLGILWHRLISIADEGVSTLVRTAFSTAVREGYDLSVMLLDADGSAAGPKYAEHSFLHRLGPSYSPTHVASLPTSNAPPRRRGHHQRPVDGDRSSL